MRIIALLDNPLYDFSRMSYRRMQACSFLSLNCLVSDFLLRNLMLPTTDQFGIFPSFSFLFFFFLKESNTLFFSRFSILMMTSAQVVETSVSHHSPSQDYPRPDDQITRLNTVFNHYCIILDP